MTVMVHGASGLLGHAIVRALVAKGEVRATVRRPEAAEPLRSLGAKVAVREVTTPDHLAEILPRVVTLIHLVGGVAQAGDEDLVAANLRSVEVALEAARAAGVARFVLLSASGARPDADHPYLRAKGEAEVAVAAAGIDHAIVRATHAYGVGGLWFTAAVECALASPPLVVGDGGQRVAPVFADDVGALVARIDDHSGPLAGTWSLCGPDELTGDELVASLAGSGAAPVHEPDPAAAAARLSGLLGVEVSPVAASLWARDSLLDGPDAAAAFGVVRTSFAEGIRETIARAGEQRVG
jgi:NADH dehydrogenase